MGITDLSQVQLNPELVNATSDLASNSIPNLPTAQPNQSGQPNQPNQSSQPNAAGLDQLGQAAPLTPASTGVGELSTPKPGTFAAKLKAASDQLGIPPGPGGWAKSLVASAQSALSGIENGLGDVAAAKINPYGGVLGAAGAINNAKRERLQGQQKAQDEHNKAMSEIDKDKATIALTNAQHTQHQMINHAMEDEHNHADVDYGKQQIEAFTTDQDKLGLKPADIVAKNLTDSQLQAAITGKDFNPTQEVFFPDGTIQPIDPATGKPAVDENGEAVHQKTYSILKVPPVQSLTKDQTDQINKYIPGVHFEYDPEHPQTLPGAQAVALLQQAHGVQMFQDKTALDLQNAKLAKLDADQKVASEEAYKRLGADSDYTKAVAHFPNDLAKTYQYMTGQYPEIVNGKPTGKPDPASLQAAKDNPTAGTDIISAYGGQKNFDTVVGKQADEATKQRQEFEKEQHDRRMEELNTQKEADKRQADLADHTDAFGNKSTLKDKEFDKRYDAFTSSTQNKTLQVLSGTYEQFQSILGDIAQGKLTGPESVAALFDAVGISATPLAGKGFRVNSNTIQEHVGARGLDQAALNKLEKITSGAVITPQQMQDYAKIALDVYKSAYINAAKEQLRTLGYTDVLPRGNNQQIDSVTGGLYLKIAGGDPARASKAANQSGWVTTPQTFGAKAPINVTTNGVPNAPNYGATTTGTAASPAATTSAAPATSTIPAQAAPQQNIGTGKDFFGNFGGTVR